jgi:hypothetical protein
MPVPAAGEGRRSRARTRWSTANKKLACSGVVLVVCGLAAAAACSVEKDYDFSEQQGQGGNGATAGRASSSGNEGGARTANGGASAGGTPGGATSVNGGSGAGESPPAGDARGTACDADADCATGHCADGFCCDAGCAGGCQACVSSKTGQPNGTCAGVLAGTDPDDECAKGDTLCGLDGTCNGAGSCLFAGPNTECADETCVDGEYTAAARCDGMGSCVSPAPLACETCANNTCEKTCAATAGCPDGFYCEASACVAKKVNGAPSEATDECTSAQCTDGVCCDILCGSSCHSCVLKETGTSDGICAPVKAGTPDSSCAPTAPNSCGYDGACNDTGDCRNWVQGTPCSRVDCVDTARVVSSACNGAALCAPVETESCGLWGCRLGACQTSCSSLSDCISSAFCAGSRCIARSEAGADCAENYECISERCDGGICCNPGEKCDCPKPPPGNLLRNPTFDDLEGWTVQSGGPIQYSVRSGLITDASYDGVSGATYDAAACTYSNGLVGSNPSGSATAAQANGVSQCVALSSSYIAHFFGANYAWGVVNLAIDLYTTPDCTGSPAKSESGAGAVKVKWKAVERSFQVDDYKSVRLSFYTEGAFFVLDEAFLTL